MTPDVPELSMIEEEYEDSSSSKNAQVGEFYNKFCYNKML
jgi:hypothetical protein